MKHDSTQTPIETKRCVKERSEESNDDDDDNSDEYEEKSSDDERNEEKEEESTEENNEKEELDDLNCETKDSLMKSGHVRDWICPLTSLTSEDVVHSSERYHKRFCCVACAKNKSINIQGKYCLIVSGRS